MFFWILFTTFSAFGAYLWFTSRHKWRCASKFPHPPTDLPVMGHMLNFEGDSQANFERLVAMADDYDRFYKLYGFGYLYIQIYAARDVEKILNSNSNINKSMDYDYLQPWLGLGLLTSTGQKWKSHRKILTPTFHFKILEDFIEVFNKNGNILCNKLEALVGGEPFNIYSYVNLAAFDNICETAMGISMNVQTNEDCEYLRAVKEACLAANTRAYKKYLQTYLTFRVSRYHRIQEKALKVLHATTEEVIRNRRQELEKRRQRQEEGKSSESDDDGINRKRRLTFLDFMLESGEFESDVAIREEVDTFMFEGHDTVSSGLGFCIYSIAANPDIQEKVYQEQVSIFGDSDRMPNYKDLQDMKYLEQVVKESQRMYPSVPIIGRTVTEDIELDGGYVLPVGTEINLMIYKLHRDPDVFPDPDVFNPENFTQEAISKRHPYAYVPFSAGPRNCIGQRFAMMEMKATISKVVRKFKLAKSPRREHKLRIAPELILISSTGINITVENRNS